TSGRMASRWAWSSRTDGAPVSPSSLGEKGKVVRLARWARKASAKGDDHAYRPFPVVRRRDGWAPAVGPRGGVGRGKAGAADPDGPTGGRVNRWFDGRVNRWFDGRDPIRPGRQRRHSL